MIIREEGNEVFLAFHRTHVRYNATVRRMVHVTTVPGKQRAMRTRVNQALRLSVSLT
jgi:hypothetical protein